LKGENPCFCAYCGHEAGRRESTTADQLRYIEPFAFNLVSSAVLGDLREAFDRQSYAGGLIQIRPRLRESPSRSATAVSAVLQQL